MTSIPKPTFPGPRPRRSSIAQAAAANRGTTESAPTETTVAGPPSAATPLEESGEVARVEPAPAAPDQAEPRVEPEAAPPAPRPRIRNGTARPSTSTGSTSNKRLAQSRDILLSVPDDLKERMVNTIAWTTPHTGINQQQKFIRKAIAELCDRLEKQFNSGKSFPAPAAED